MQLSTLFVVALALVAEAYAGSAHKSIPQGRPVKEPSYFTSAFSTRAINTTIINSAGASVPGQPGAFGHFAFRINSDKNVICWDIRTVGVTGEYQSPAFTATHIHQADAGASGPPRIAFPNPQYVRNDVNGVEIRESKGCYSGPFRTNVTTASGLDSGTQSGFTLQQIEQNPAGFFADTHTKDFSAGAIRGQLLRSETVVNKPRGFTSILYAKATPDTIIAPTGGSTPGLEGAKGYYTLRLNTNENIVCYDIRLTGFKGQTYFSPAKTATHSHMATAGTNGPPRLAYKNPEPRRRWYWFGKKTKDRYSSACIKGPFTTGLLANGVDTGSASGWTLKQLEDNPTAYFSDVHTEARQAGAVRGQLARI